MWSVCFECGYITYCNFIEGWYILKCAECAKNEQCDVRRHTVAPLPLTRPAYTSHPSLISSSSNSINRKLHNSFIHPSSYPRNFFISRTFDQIQMLEARACFYLPYALLYISMENPKKAWGERFHIVGIWCRHDLFFQLFFVGTC